MIPPKVNFVKLDQKEREVRYNTLLKKDQKVKIWLKGSQNKFEFSFDDYNQDENYLSFEKIDISLIDKEVLFNFESNGQIFFGQGYLKREPESFHLTGIDNVYKSERRKNFRLLCYPMFDIISRFDIEDTYENQNVISFSTKENYDEIKKEFLSLYRKVDINEVGSFARARVHDISATGIGIYIGEMEKKHFADNRIFKDVKVQFFENVLSIDEVKVVYAMPAKGELEGTYKIGMNFENLSETDEQIIVRKINQVLKEYDFEKDFEDFI